MTAAGVGLHLSNFQCFAVYHANIAIWRANKPILGRLGLTYPQYLAVVCLWKKDGQTVGEIGKQLLLETGTVTPLLKRLEAFACKRCLVPGCPEGEKSQYLLVQTQVGLRAGGRV
ncbi:MarR family winged helix-turn-helix transcriptional regulator [Microvirga roseola]|uniref:MarR family winged helix-turn-helix transcriptional regulator n=1 Tax=Microvirga roseola TaxID=2883126 RepID=UPI003898FBC0